MLSDDELRAPFPWFGGKRRVADLVWSRLGNVPTYNEPFAGSLAVLLGRPHEPRVETVNDLDCYLANFWRALQHDPDAVVHHADGPVNEADLHARHRWLTAQLAGDFRQRMTTDPLFYDAQIAGWWVWGQCLWIGSGWCNGAPQQQKPYLRREGGIREVLNRRQGKRFAGVGNGQGAGVHRRFQDDGNDGGSVVASTGGLYDYMLALSARLRRVRVCCGDWQRVLTPSVTTYVGLCGVFLDPPYAHDLRERCYSEDHDISADVRTWALANGNNPSFRIAYCGYDDGTQQFPSTWECVPWKAHGGYGRTARSVGNRERERVWFSPHCLKGEPPLFEAAEC